MSPLMFWDMSVGAHIPPHHWKALNVFCPHTFPVTSPCYLPTSLKIGDHVSYHPTEVSLKREGKWGYVWLSWGNRHEPWLSLAKLVIFLRIESQLLSMVHGITHAKPLLALWPHVWTHWPCLPPSWPHISFPAHSFPSTPLHMLFLFQELLYPPPHPPWTPYSQLILQLTASTAFLHQSVSQPLLPTLNLGELYLPGASMFCLTTPVTVLTPKVSTGQCSVSPGDMCVLTTIVFLDWISSQHRVDACWMNHLIRTCAQDYKFILTEAEYFHSTHTKPHLA